MGNSARIDGEENQILVLTEGIDERPPFLFETDGDGGIAIPPLYAVNPISDILGLRPRILQTDVVLAVSPINANISDKRIIHQVR
jgi:hypothetical protein